MLQKTKYNQFKQEGENTY